MSFFFFCFRVQRSPSMERPKRSAGRKTSENGGRGELSESELEKQRALLLAQLKEPESD